MTRVAFLIVTWNNEGIIAECLESVLGQQGVEPVVLVQDNDSSDGTADLVAGRFPEVRLVRSPGNAGFARANNDLLRLALADETIDYLALVNSDAVLAPDWAARLVGFAAGHERLATLQGLTLDYTDHGMVDSRHLFLDTSLQGRQYGHGEPVDPADKLPRRVFGVNMAAAMVTREFALNQPEAARGLFDERFYMYYEDVDLACRAFVSGYESYAVPDAIAYHRGSVSARQRRGDYWLRMVARNQPAVAFKNLPFRTILSSLPAAIRGQLGTLRAVWRLQGGTAAVGVGLAMLRGTLTLPRYHGSRRRIGAARVVGADRLESVMRTDGLPDDDPSQLK